VRKRKEKDDLENESMFERWFREEQSKKLAQHDALFFGAAVLFALYATQGMFAIH